MSDLSNVKVGDTLVYSPSRYKVIAVVTRITPTQVHTTGYKFNKMTGHVIGSSFYFSARPATNEDLEENRIKGIELFLEKVQWNSVSKELKIQFHDLLLKEQKEKEPK